MARSGERIIKLSKNLKPFVSRVVRDGQAQRDFAVSIGKPVGACVAGKVREGMSGKEIHDIVKNCAKPFKGKKIKGSAGKKK